MAEIHYRDGAVLDEAPDRQTHANPDIVAFEELHELHRIVERGPDWNDIDRIVITLNRPSRAPAKGSV
jgi:hypothetical protein